MSVSGSAEIAARRSAVIAERLALSGSQLAGPIFCAGGPGCAPLLPSAYMTIALLESDFDEVSESDSLLEELEPERFFLLLRLCFS